MEMSGVNYLIPIDARLATDREVQFEAVPLDRRVPAARILAVLGLVTGFVTAPGTGTSNLFGVDLSDVELRADDLEWTSGAGALVTGSAQLLALVACGRLLPPGRLGGEAAPRFSGS